MNVVTPYPTVGSIAAMLRVPVHRIRYVIESRGIEPAGRAAHARVFTETQVEQIRSEILRMNQAKEADHG